jgi:hypothetical protein
MYYVVLQKGAYMPAKPTSKQRYFVSSLMLSNADLAMLDELSAGLSYVTGVPVGRSATVRKLLELIRLSDIDAPDIIAQCKRLADRKKAS